MQAPTSVRCGTSRIASTSSSVPKPSGTREAADAAVQELGWTQPYFLDADHINLKTFERFVAPCDFFTIDVADNIGQKSDDAEIAKFVERHPELTGSIAIPRIAEPFHIDPRLR